MKKFVLILAALLSTTVMNAQSEDQLALKKLVDTLSNLADAKDIKSQMDYFIDDAIVCTKDGKNVYTFNGKAEIERAFTDFVASFDVVYHLNGQYTVDIDGDMATGVSYCFVTLIGDGKCNQSGECYRDTYVKQNGCWLIKRRESNIMFTKTEDLKL